jgi:23S rRNA pseudouridine2605 synthase
MEERLQKVLAAAGIGSRRACEELIAAGKVTVDGKPVSQLGVKVDPDKSAIAVSGKPVALTPEKIYILLNKPRGFTSTRSDPHAKHTVMELVRDVRTPVYPVGRLDVDSEGMLILTNDGDFTFKLTHPSHEAPKTYVADVRGKMFFQELRSLSYGIELEDGKTSPAKVQVLGFDRRSAVSRVEITIHEGKKRQVRRMFEAVNHPVQRLVRTRVGNVSLDDLPSGQWRPLTKREVKSLLETATPEPKPVPAASSGHHRPARGRAR